MCWKIKNSVSYQKFALGHILMTLIVLLGLKLAACQIFNFKAPTKTRVIRNMVSPETEWYFKEAANKSESPSLLTVTCNTIQNDNCKLMCMVSSNDRQSLIDELEQRYALCKDPMQLTLQGSPFPTGATFTKADLNGEFELKTLKLDKCERFSKIEDYAFDKRSLNNLKELTILQDTNNGIEFMNEHTFAGLKSLKRLEFRNTAARKKLTAVGVLAPLADNLEFLKFEQTSVREGTGDDPGSWFAGPNFTKLEKVDLRNSYFRKALSMHAFGNLESVIELHLAGCAIEFIEDDTLLPIMQTLKYLDLSDNELTTLSHPILIELSSQFVDLKLLGNSWDCSCDNAKFMEFIQNGYLNLNSHVAPICATPLEWATESATNVDLHCDQQSEEGKEVETTKSSTTTSTTETTTEAKTTTTKTSSTTETSTDKSSEVISICFDEIQLSDEPMYFHIKSISADSVLITFEKHMTAHDLFYFIPHRANSEHQQPIENTQILITALYSDCTYVFCLVATHAQLVTAFNCRAHHVMLQGMLNDDAESWLSSKDRSIFLGLTIFLAFVCCIVGLLVIYLVLRFKPTLIFKAKGFAYNGMNSLLDPSTENTASIKDEETYDDWRTHAAIYAEDYTSCLEVVNATAPVLPPSTPQHAISTKDKFAKRKSNDYLKYKRASELTTLNMEATSLPENLPPPLRAPALPPLHKTPADELKILSGSIEPYHENEYQSVDEFERVYEVT